MKRTLVAVLSTALLMSCAKPYTHPYKTNAEYLADHPEVKEIPAPKKPIEYAPIPVWKSLEEKTSAEFHAQLQAKLAKEEQEDLAYEQTYWPGLRKNFPPLAKKLNYVCDQVTRFRFIDLTERGTVYRIDCDRRYSYRMLQMPDDRISITPWIYR